MALLLFGTKGRPTKLYNFLGGVLPSDLTFTRASSGGRTNPSGLCELVSDNVPRFDYDPIAHTAKGLLIEPFVTNLLLYSTPQIANTFWNSFTTNVITTANAAESPDGSMTATLVNNGIETNCHFFYCTPTTPSATTHTFSLYAKYVSAQYIQLLMDYGNGYADFDLVNGVAGSTNGISSTIESVGNGWYRIQMVSSMPAGSVTKVGIGIVKRLTAPRRQSYTGTSATLLVWGAQLEEGTSATSHIPTAGTAVTRAADSLSFTVPANATRLHYVFNDDSTQDVTVSAGAYTAPTNLDRAWIKQIVGYPS